MLVPMIAALALLQGQTPGGDWPAYGHDLHGTRYSPLTEINPQNVSGLRLAWIYRTGDYLSDRSRFEANPIMVNGTLYVSTPLGRVSAIDPVTGAERWSFDAQVGVQSDFGDFTNRGVATWSDARARAGVACHRRVFLATVDARLIALDASTGRPCDGFGAHGTVDLAHSLRNTPAYRYEYGVTSPPTIVGDLVIVGSAISDNQRTNAPEGTVRAFDARSGALRWSWDPIARSAADTGPLTGAANAWTVFAADPARDLVFIPTGSASPDFYGGERPGDNHDANAVVALQASTGKLVWSFQVAHHDLWDYDVPAQPVLFTWRSGARAVPAVAVATKMGHLFILDRATGRPLVPVEERAVPASDVPGERAWPTQPFPPSGYRFVPESLMPSDAFGLSDSMKTICRAWISGLRYEGIFTPPSLKGTIIWPGNIGGMNWSGVAFDERRGLVIAPANRLAMVVTLIPQDSLHAARMAHPDEEISRQRGTPYGMMRQTLTYNHVPCTPPPWGTLTAFDVAAGTARWQVPLGVISQLAQVPGSDQWGSINLGGAIVTAGGVVFVAGAMDQQLRAIDETTGRELWSGSLPAGAQSLPATYRANGHQFVVVSAGGHDRLGTTMGDYVLAFALPDPAAPAVDTLTPPASPAGVYAGALTVGGARIGLQLRIDAAGDAWRGSIDQIDSLVIKGTVEVQQTGRTAGVAFDFDYPQRQCEGRIAATGAWWNGGHLFEGDVTVTGSCTGDHPQHGTLALRRP